MFLIGEWTVHRDFDSLTRHDEEVHVTPRAMDVLVHLAEHQGKLVTKEELLDRFWRGAISGDNAVHKTMAELRRVFKDSSKNPRYNGHPHFRDGGFLPAPEDGKTPLSFQGLLPG